MALVCHKVSSTWDLLCCDDPSDLSTFNPPTSRLRLVNAATSTLIDTRDPETCAELLPQFSVEWDPATGALCTCELPANIGTDETTFLEPGGTVYEWTVTFAGQTRVYRFQLDADADYSALVVDGCIPVCHVEIDSDTPPLTDVFSDRVCATDCIASLIGQVTQNTTNIANIAGDVATLVAQIAALDYVTSVSVGAPDANGNVEIRYTTSQGNGGSAGVVPEPADVFVTGITSGSVLNADGSTTTTYTVALSDGSTIPFTYDHVPSAVPTSVDIDPATGTVTITFTNPDGSTFTLTDTVAPFADTNTTNSTFVFDPITRVLTITDSEGNALSATVPDSDTISSITENLPAGTWIHNDNDPDGNTATTIASTSDNPLSVLRIGANGGSELILNKNVGGVGVSDAFDPAADVLLTDDNVQAEDDWLAANPTATVADDSLPVFKDTAGDLRHLIRGGISFQSTAPATVVYRSPSRNGARDGDFVLGGSEDIDPSTAAVTAGNGELVGTVVNDKPYPVMMLFNFEGRPVATHWDDPVSVGLSDVFVEFLVDGNVRGAIVSGRAMGVGSNQGPDAANGGHFTLQHRDYANNTYMAIMAPGDSWDVHIRYGYAQTAAGNANNPLIEPEMTTGDNLAVATWSLAQVTAIGVPV